MRAADTGCGEGYAAVVKESMLGNTAKHEMTVLLNTDKHIHLRFATPGSGVFHFDLVTWPGYLCICGDMGSFVFQRLEDMFKFFRTPSARELLINPGYWAEKLTAADTTKGYEAFSPEVAAEQCRDYLDGCDLTLSKDEQSELRTILNCSDTDETQLRDQLARFTVGGERVFSEVWEMTFRAYTFRYIWCCWAIVWGIRKYDEHMAAPSK